MTKFESEKTYQYKDNRYFKKVVAICLLGIVLIVCTTFIETFIYPEYPHSGSLESNTLRRFIDIVLLFTFGFVTDKRPLVIRSESILLPLNRYQIWRKREVIAEDISRIFSRKYCPKYRVWNPHGLIEMPRLNMTVKEYEQAVGDDAAWIETQDRKTYFISYKDDFPDIYFKLYELWGDRIKKIKIDDELMIGLVENRLTPMEETTHN